MKQFICKNPMIDDIIRPPAPFKKNVTIIDQFGDPLESVHVIGDISGLRTISNASGAASIETTGNDIITFSHIGKVSKKVPFLQLGNVVTLTDSIENLDDVVIISKPKVNKSALWIIALALGSYLIFKSKPKKVNL